MGVGIINTSNIDPKTLLPKAPAPTATQAQVRAVDNKVAAAPTKGTTVTSPPSKPIDIQVKATQDALDGQQQIFFPSDLEQTRKYFSLTFSSYNRKDINSPSNIINTDAIMLPLPNNLNEYVKTQWDDVSMTIMGLGGFDESMANFVQETAKNYSVGNAVSNAGTFIKSIGNKVQNDSGLSYALLRRGISALSETAAVIADQAMGATANPHMGIAFRGVPLRTHTFTWRLAPESARETSDLRNIIAMLKGRSLPQKAGDFLLTYPDMCQPRIFINGAAQDQLFMMKRCVVQDVRVNYAGGGAPSFFQQTGGPTVIDLSITLKELTIVTRSDYEVEFSGGGR